MSIFQRHLRGVFFYLLGYDFHHLNFESERAVASYGDSYIRLFVYMYSVFIVLLFTMKKRSIETIVFYGDRSRVSSTDKNLYF